MIFVFVLQLLYAGMPISNVFKEDLGLGGVISLLWFQRRLPQYTFENLFLWFKNLKFLKNLKIV